MWARAQPEGKRTVSRPLSSLLRPSPRRTPVKPATAPGPRGPDFDFAALPLLPAKTTLPRANGDEQAIKVNAPPKGSQRHKPAAPVKAEPICDVPKSMYAVTGGPFLDGLSMDEYYPDLIGTGSWAHGATAGTWDTGTRCGANVQLVGGVNLLCRPELFQLEQTVTHTKSIFDGKPDSDHGTTHDDIADSGRNFSKAPARQERGGDVPEAILYREGMTAPQELRISMADPISLLYTPFRTVEWDRTYVTTLKGPKGSKSVTWYTSIEIKDRRVVKNTIK